MKNNLFLIALSFSLLVLSVSAQPATNPVDAAAVILIQSSFPALGVVNSSVDPCLPTPFSWLTCSSDDNPRITALNCGNKELSGALVDFSLMDALETIDFSNNHFTLEFPDFLAKFPKLKELNLANNNFNGTAPTSLEYNKNLKLTLKPGNPDLCFSDDNVCPRGSRIKTVFAVIIIAVFVIVIA